MALADTVCQHILNGNSDRALQSNVVTLSASLKLYGQQLETIYKGNLLGCTVKLQFYVLSSVSLC